MAGFNVGTLEGSVVINFGSVQEAEQAIKSLKGSFTSQQKAAKNLEKSYASVAKGTRQVEQSTRKAEAAEKARINAISQADSKTRSLSQVTKEYSVRTRAQEVAVKNANKSIEVYKRVVEQSGARSVKAAKAKAMMTKRVNTAKTAVSRHGKEVKNLQSVTQDLTKSVQLALGPLSGVASRITAMTALFNRNTLAVAGVVGAFTGLSVALFQSVRAGAKMEQQMYKLDTVLQTTGNATRFTKEELNDLAIELGKSTMTSAGLARDALSTMMTFGITSKGVFEEAMFAAQGLSVVMGGDLQSNTRRLGRLLNAPSRNLSSLTRAGIQFTKQQEEMIKKMEKTGDLAGAQALVMGRLKSFTKAATGETQGLNGAIDTAGENFLRLFENASLNAGAIDSLTSIVNEFSKELENLADNEQVIQSLGTAFNVMGKVAAGTLSVVINNVDKLAAVVAGAGIVLAVGRINASFAALSVSAKAAAGSMGIFSTSVAVAKARVDALTMSIRANPLGALLSVTAAVATWAYFNKEIENTNSNLRQSRSEIEGITSAFKQFNMEAGAEAFKERNQILNSYIRTQQKLKNELLDLQKQQFNAARSGGKVSEEVRNRIVVVKKYLSQIDEEINSMREKNKEDKESLDLLRQLKENFSAASSEIESLNSKYVEGGDKVTKWSNDLTNAQETLRNFDKQVAEDKKAQQLLADQFGITRQKLVNLIAAIDNADPRLDVWRDFREEMSEIDSQVSALKNNLGVDMDIAKALLGDVNPEVISRLAEDLDMVGASAERVAIALQGKRDKQGFLESFIDFNTEAVTGKIRKIEKEFAGIRQGARVKFDGDIPPDIKARIDAEEEAQRRIAEMQAKEVATSKFTDLDSLELELAQREQMLADYYGRETEDYKDHMRIMEQNAKRSKAFLQFSQGAETAATVVTSAMDVMSAANREQTKEFQALALAQTIISQAAAIGAIWAEPGNFYVKLGQTAIAGAMVGAQIAQIQSTNFASGGLVRGPGTGTSDDIPANLSNGEYVMKADAVRNIGVPQLNAMNQGRAQNYASGGSVGRAPTTSAGNTTVNVIDQRSGGAPVETRETMDSSGNKQIEMLIRDVVNNGMARGDFDRTMRGSYGINRPGRRI